MVDLPAVARSSVEWLHRVARARDMSRKILLLSLLIARLFPRTVRRRYPAVSVLRAKIIESVIRKVIVTYRNCAFHMVDERSLGMLCEDYEPWAWSYFALPRGAVFVDVGAHIGRYAIPIAKLVGVEGLVVAIEPAPENYRVLVENVKLNKLRNVIALNVAAWNSNGELDLYLGIHGGLHSVKERTSRKVRVSAKTLDAILEELGVARVDAIKIDVEGAEVEVLEGMEKTVKRCAPRVLVEVRWPHLEKLTQILEAWGYRAEPIPNSEKGDMVYFICEPGKMESTCGSSARSPPSMVHSR